MARSRGKKLTSVIGLAVIAVAVVMTTTFWDTIRAHYVFWRQFEGLPDSEQDYPEYKHRQTGIVFVRVPDGTFWMGTSSEDAESFIEEFGESWRSNLATEQPRHEVTLSPFLIAKYEVKQAEWTRMMGSDPSELLGENLPVERVSWNDCQEFCQKTGLALPTEAQWEYSCRAGTNTRFAFGDTLTTTQASFDIRFRGLEALATNSNSLRRKRWPMPSSQTCSVSTTCTGMSGSGVRTSMTKVSIPDRKRTETPYADPEPSLG